MLDYFFSAVKLTESRMTKNSSVTKYDSARKILY